MPEYVNVPGRGVVSFPDGTPPEAMEKALAEFRQSEQAPTPAASHQAPAEEGWLSSAADWLPTAGSIGGSLAGGTKVTPLGILGAGVGGAAGEAARQGIRLAQGRGEDVPDTLGDSLYAIGKEGVVQSGMEALGGTLFKAAGYPARWAYKKAIAPYFNTARELAGGDLAAGMEQIVEQGLKDKILPNASGAARAERLMRASEGDATQLATQSGRSHQTTDLLSDVSQDQMTKLADEFRVGIDPQPGVKRLTEHLRTTERANPTTLTDLDLVKLRRIADRIADPAQVKKAAGERVVPGSEGAVTDAFRGAAKKRLDEIPMMRATNAQTSARHAVRDAARVGAARPNRLQDALITSGALGGAAFGGKGVAAALAARAALDPTVQAAGAIALQPMARGLPRTADVLSGGEVSGGIGDMGEELKRALLAMFGQGEDEDKAPQPQEEP